MERYLDVSTLEAPEPLERILSSVDALGRGESLHVYHRRDPLLLFPLLQDRDCRWLSGRDDDDMVHVFIWRDGDDGAARAAAEAFARCTRA